MHAKSTPMPRLSICIATLNRVEYIGETLDSIIGQMNDDTELVIVDGASTDGTDGVVRRKFAERGNCHYHRLERKGGIDQDYDLAVTLANGEFVWLMTDDDIVHDGAITSVLSILQDDVDLALLNVEVASTDLKFTLVRQKMKITGDRRFAVDEFSQIMEICGDLLSFIGCVVIRRSEWMTRERCKYYGTEFVHVGVIFQRSFSRSAIAIASPMIRIRYGNAMWLERGAIIWLFKWPELVWSFDHLPERSRQAVVSRHPWEHLTVLLAMKARGWVSTATYNRLFRDLKVGFVVRVKMLIVCYFPDVVFNYLACLVCRLVFRRERGIHIDLRKSRFYFRKYLSRS
jgi:abequosyltransferase